MITYVALFRGINVGGKNILPMKDLVGILEGIGCENVKTYIQSGNAVFRAGKIETKKLEETISSKILETRRFSPKVLLLEHKELTDAIENNPYKNMEGKTLHFFFLESIPVNPDMNELVNVKSKSEKFKLGKKIFYLYAPDGIGRSKLAAKVERALGVPVTARNWNTVSKLAEMAGLA
jgi:uncharacterized protein (DUF1697 family)